MASTLAKNATANLLQMLFSAGALFVLYRYINASLGVSQLGVWSVVLASASLSRLADLGLGAGITRFVARDLAVDQGDRAVKVIETGTLTLAAVLALVLPLSYPLLAWALGAVFDQADHRSAESVLPYALISIWLSVVTSVVHSGLDGCQRMDLRALVATAAQLLMVVLAFVLVPHWGLRGLAIAYVGQGILSVVAGWLLLRRLLPGLAVVPRRWDRAAFREMLGYGANVQAATLALLFLDPITKALLAKFGGSAAAGYFEMANQIVLRARSLIVAANQAIVPRASQVSVAAPDALATLYAGNLRIIVFVTLPVFALMVGWAPVFSTILVSRPEPALLAVYHVCALAWFVNTLATPAYHINLGSGAVGLNTLSHVIIGVVNLALGLLLGPWLGAQGVVYAYAIALVIGSLFLVLRTQSRYGVGLIPRAPGADVQLLVACLVAATIGSLAGQPGSDAGTAARLATYLLVPAILLISSWLHPVRKEIASRLLK